MRKRRVIISFVFISCSLRIGLILFIFCSLNSSVKSQTKLDSLLGKLDPQKFAASVKKKAEKLEDKLVQKSMKMLEKMQQQEEKIYKKMLGGKDSLIAKAKFSELKDKYFTLKDKLKNPALLSKATTYLPKLDSLSTSLKFLDQNGIGGKVKDALTKTASLQDKFQQAEEIKKFIKERREQLKQQLEKLGMVKRLKQINKQVYYYAAQIKEYTEILKDPKKVEKKALELLSKTKWYQEFFKKNSMLASLFRMPGDPNDPTYLASLAGLQTRRQVNSLIQQQIQGGGPNARQQLQQNMQAAQAQLQELKNKVLKAGGGSSDDIMPEGFRPNDQKTKTFLQRLEYGTNLQTNKSNGWWPNNTDIALSVGYKINDKSVIGIGGSYKLGLGRGWNAIRLTSEGIGIRAFIDWKLKGNFWLSGGYEMNYKTPFANTYQLQNLNAWQQSGLLGISKSVPIKSKFFKKTKLQLLWDFLSVQQRPKTKPIVFRIGYNF